MRAVEGIRPASGRAVVTENSARVIGILTRSAGVAFSRRIAVSVTLSGRAQLTPADENETTDRVVSASHTGASHIGESEERSVSKVGAHAFRDPPGGWNASVAP